MHLSHPTISGQIHRLEEVLGQKLFLERGKRAVQVLGIWSRGAFQTPS